MGRKLTMEEKASRNTTRTRNGEGKSRNSVNHAMKMHFTYNGVNLCNAFNVVPKSTSEKGKVTCTNCLKHMARL